MIDDVVMGVRNYLPNAPEAEINQALELVQTALEQGDFQGLIAKILLADMPPGLDFMKQMALSKLEALQSGQGE